MKINILYEDKDVLAINKPAGVSVHGDGKTKEVTISDWFAKEYPKSKNVGEPLTIEYKGEKIKILRSGIVHRLDKETSGCLVLAKNQKSFEFIKNQFQTHKIIKTYRAFVYGFVSDPRASLKTGKRGVINAPIGRSPKDVRMWTAGRGAKEPVREAVTEYVVLDRFTDTKSEKGKKSAEHQFSYIEAYPKTGRTHQIRVHFRYINHPIVSDPLYSGSKDLALGMKRLALHAFKLKLNLPNGQNLEIEAPLTTDFKKAIKTFNISLK